MIHLNLTFALGTINLNNGEMMSWNKYEKAAEKGPWPLFWKLLFTISPMLLIIIIIGAALKIPGLEWIRFYETKKQNIQREVFENTQSYTHGKIQDLAKYYEEYQKAESTERDAIRSVILMRFAEFDTQKINNNQLRNFLITIRGY